MVDENGGLREERRVVTALFADIVGSTSLGERLDPEDLKLIVADAIARMVDAVEVFGGTVKTLQATGCLPSSVPRSRTKTTLSEPFTLP